MQIQISSPKGPREFVQAAYAHARDVHTKTEDKEYDSVARRVSEPHRPATKKILLRGRCFLVADDEGPLAMRRCLPGPDETYA